MAALSVLGTSSWAGKSLVATALCRWFAREGLRVAPFKAVNMSNNARVAVGGEIGSAQYFQALAAGIEPTTRMNPVLVKPEADRRSQVVVLGRVDEGLSATPWQDRAPALHPPIEESLSALLADFDLVLIEGAGSPAEINLAAIDLANRYATDLAGGGVLLVADIGRGGAFAHLYGTWALVDDSLRGRIGGFVLNRFRGDPGLLDPGPAELKRLTEVPTVGVLPELDHGLPDEDGAARRPLAGGRARIAVIPYPTASNLDEFRPLEQVADLVWARRQGDLAGTSVVVLPGSKEPFGDLDWLHESGLAGEIRAAAKRGDRVLGICGGLQLLGTRLGDRPGLDLLPVATEFEREKITREREAVFGALGGAWQALAGKRVLGYEIRQGWSEPAGPLTEALPDGLGWAQGNVLGIYLHGLFEDPAIVGALLGEAPGRAIDEVFEDLADAVDRHLDMRRVRALAGIGSAALPPAAAGQPPAAPSRAPRSLVLLNTGDGKGKSTAAFGVLLRAVARRGWQACVIQFVKSDRWKVGEEDTARRLGVHWVKGGDGFSWESRDLAGSEERARDAWRLAREAIEGGAYRLVVLDEITYPINWGWLDGGEVASVIRARPERVNVIATGRDAPPALVAVADTVTEMVKVRHAYDRGIKARRGLDF